MRLTYMRYIFFIKKRNKNILGKLANCFDFVKKYKMRTIRKKIEVYKSTTKRYLTIIPYKIYKMFVHFLYNTLHFKQLILNVPLEVIWGNQLILRAPS